MVKDRFKTFNVQFEEAHQRQSQWTVPDSELRESLRLAVAEVLLPAFRSFLKRFGYVFISLWNVSPPLPSSLSYALNSQSSFLFLYLVKEFNYCFHVTGLWLRVGKIPISTSDTLPRILIVCWMNSLRVRHGMNKNGKHFARICDFCDLET